MSLLDQLWDNTVAGPPPENGLGKLRESTSSNLRSASGKAETERVNGEDGVRVTRSIMIMKPSGQTGSAPVSPAGSPPVSPFAGIAIGSGWQAVAAIWHMNLKVILLMCLSLTWKVSAQTPYDVQNNTTPKGHESYPLKELGLIFIVFVVVVGPIICCLKRTCGHPNFCGSPDDQSGVELTVPEHPMCSICQKNMLNGQVIRTLPECNHSYHEECWWECIQQWAEPTCPLCHMNYLPDAEV